MRRVLYALAGIAVLAFALSRCWPGSKQDAKRAHEIPSAAPQGVDPMRRSGQTLAAIVGGAQVDAGRVTSTDESVIRQLRDYVNSNPELAETIAREDQQRFPDSPYADERDALLVASVFNQHKVDEARYEAIHYFKRHPHGRFTDLLAKSLGMGTRGQQGQ